MHTHLSVDDVVFLQVWHKKYVILRRASSKGPCCLEMYNDNSNISTEMCKYTDLSSVLSITRISKKYGFTINFTDGTLKDFYLESGIHLYSMCVAGPLSGPVRSRNSASGPIILYLVIQTNKQVESYFLNHNSSIPFCCTDSLLMTHHCELSLSIIV